MCCGQTGNNGKCQCKKYCFTECVTITSTVIDANGDLIITLSDGTVYNAGSVNNGYRPVIFSKGEWTDPTPSGLPDYDFSVLQSMLPKIGDYLLLKISFQIQQFPSFTGSFHLDAEGTGGTEGLLLALTAGYYEVEVMLKRTDYNSGGPVGTPYAFLRATTWKDGGSSATAYVADSVSLPLDLSFRLQVNTGSASVKMLDYSITKFLQP